MKISLSASSTLRYIVFASVFMLSANAFCQEDYSKRSFYVISKAKYVFPTATGLFGTGVMGGTSASFELLHGTIESLSIGIGAEYQFQRRMERHRSRTISFLPFYYLFRYSVYNSDYVKLYVGGQVGHNLCFLNDDYKELYKSKGGIYRGIVIGTIIKNKVIFESGLSIHDATTISKETGDKDGIGCFELTTGLGMIFN